MFNGVFVCLIVNLYVWLACLRESSFVYVFVSFAFCMPVCLIACANDIVCVVYLIECVCVCACLVGLLSRMVIGLSVGVFGWLAN